MVSQYGRRHCRRHCQRHWGRWFLGCHCRQEDTDMDTFLVIFLESFVCCFLLLNHCWGIIMDLRVFSRASQGAWNEGFLESEPRCKKKWKSPTYPLALSPFKQNGVARSSYSTWTTSLAVPIPFSSSSSRSTTTTLTTRGLCPDGFVVLAGPKFVGLAGYSEGPQ